MDRAQPAHSDEVSGVNDFLNILRDNWTLLLVGHLREEKDPLTAARAIRRIADESSVSILFD